jgi:lysophospholipase L1-like esterase
MKFLIALFASTLPLLAQSPWDVSLAQPTVSALSYSNIIWDKFLTAEASVFLENGDNGATYMNDDVHPNHGGYMLTAKKWRETLGL